MKKTLALVLALMMVLGTMSVTVFADAAADIYAIGEGKTYGTWSAAIAAGTDADGDGVITYQIYGKVLVNEFAIKGNAKTVNIVGMTADAELCSATANPADFGLLSITGAEIENVNFSDIKLSRPNGGWRGNEGHHNCFFSVWDYDASTKLVSYTNCVFPNGSGNNQFGKTTYKNCTFKNDSYYALWIYAYGTSTVAEVEGCTFDAARGVKVFAEAATAEADVSIEDSTFAITEKPAIVSSLGGTLDIKKVDASACPYGLLAAEPSAGQYAEITVDGKAPAYVAKAGDVYCTDVDYANAEASDTKPVEVIVAEVDGTYYTDLVSALKALQSGSTLNLLADVTITDKWDNRNTGAKITVPVTIDGNGHKIKFTNEINDGFNYLAAFRVEDDATFKNLTIDLSEAISVFNGRFSAISTNGCDLTVDNCKFIGSEVYTSARAIIFGERGSEADEAVISVTGSQFANFLYGVVDNMNGVDVAKNVTIATSEFMNAGIQVSASEKVVLTSNIVEDAYVNVTSYSPTNELTVEVSGNTLEEAANGKENSIVAKEISGQGGFATPVADVNGKKYLDLQTAINKAADGDTIKIIEDIELSETAYTSPANPFKFSGYYGLMIPDNKEVTIDLNGKTISYKDTHGACDSSAVYNIGNLTIDDSSADKTGKIVFADVLDNVNYNQNHAVIFNVSTLTVNAGTIEHMDTGNGTVSDAIDNNSNISYNYGKDAICTINGGTLIGADYRAIRQYTHYNEGVLNRVTINGGVVKGGIYMQHGDSWYYANPAAGRLNVDCKLTINGGTITTVMGSDGVPYGHIRSYLCNPDNAEFGLTINGGKIEVPVQVMVQRGAYYANGVSGTIVSSEATGTRTAEWLENNGGFIYGGTFTELGDANDAKTNLAGFLAENTKLQRTGSDLYTVINSNDANDDAIDDLQADSISIEYKDITATDAEGEKTYEVYVKANDDDMINELASVDLTFDFATDAVDDGAMNITVLPTKDFTMSTAENDRYMFNYNGTTAYEGTANAIAIATIKVEGYGKFSIATKDLSATANDTNIVNATTVKDNLVDSYTAAGATDSDTTTGALIINKDTDTTDELVGGVANVEIAVPTRKLTINIAFPNAVENNVKAYQAMSVRVAGGNYDETFALGTDGKDYNFELDLPYNTAYTVTVSGAGYRTARYTVTLNDNKTLNFWNNVMDEDKEVEVGKTSSAVKQNFLAGDIVKDNNINIYDLSAVVSYFATTTDRTAESTYAKYDLNRDGVIDSKDVAYVLVSWNN